VERDTPRAAERADLRDRLDRPQLVVRGHHGDEHGLGTQRVRDPLHVHDAGRVDRDDGHRHAAALQRLQRLQHRRVLDRGRDHVALGDQTADHEVVGFRRPRGEHDLLRVCADERGHLRARLLDRVRGLLAESVVLARRVPEALGEVRQHRVEHRGVDRRRRVVVEVDALHPVHISDTAPRRAGLQSPASRG
jgi:hypothetical protein